MRITADFHETMNMIDNKKEKIVVLDGRNGRVLETDKMFDFDGEYNQLIEFAIDVAEDMTNDTFYKEDTEIGYTCMNDISYFVVHVSSYPHNMYVCFPVYFNVMANPVGKDIEKTWGFKDIVPMSIRGNIGESRRRPGRSLREARSSGMEYMVRDTWKSDVSGVEGYSIYADGEKMDSTRSIEQAADIADELKYDYRKVIVVDDMDGFVVYQA